MRLKYVLGLVIATVTYFMVAALASPWFWT